MRNALLLPDVLLMRDVLIICTGKGSRSEGRQQCSTGNCTEKQACVSPQPCAYIHHGKGRRKQKTGC